MTKKMKRVIGIFCMIICMIAVSIQSPITATNVETFESVVTMSKVELYKDMEMQKPVTEGEVISLKDTLYMLYRFEITEEQVENIKSSIATSPDTKCMVNIPEGLQSATDSRIELVTDTGVKFADFHINAEECYLVFNGAFWEDGYTDLTDAYIQLPCGLDKDVIQDSKNYALALDSSTTINILVAENQDLAHEYNKVGNYNPDDKQIEWTINYIVGSDIEQDVYLVDTFNNEEQVYLDGSFQINGIAFNVANLSINTNANQTEIRYLLDADSISVGDSITFSYKTTLSDAEIEKQNEDTIANNAVVFEKEDGTLLGEVKETQVTVPQADKEWLSKTGTQNSNDERLIDWEIIINTNDRRLKDLLFHDQIPTGLTLEGNTVNVDGTPIAVSEKNTDENGNTTFTVAIPKEGAVYRKNCKVTYTTKVDDRYYEEAEGKMTFNNKAWLTFDWERYDGPGEWVPYVTPEIEKGIEIDTRIITKAGEYNRSNHTITWKINVNIHNVDIISGQITDDFTELGQTVDLDSFTSDNPAITLNRDSSTNKSLIFDIAENGLGTDGAQITFKATVDDPKLYGYNNNPAGRLHNKANFSGKVQPSNNEQLDPINVNDTASASVRIPSEVVKKEGIAYDYSDNTITWKVTVNQNNMPMENAVLEDTIDEKQAYVEGSTTGVEESKVKYSDDTRKLKIELGDIGSRKEVTFKTKVDVNAVEAFKKDSVVEVENGISLLRSNYDKLDVTGKRKIDNNLLKKAGQLLEDNNYIGYSVNINENGLDLKGVTLKDTLPRGLKLDVGTVVLFEATIDKDGKFTLGNEVKDAIWSYDNETNSFAVEMPEGTGRYILNYEAFIEDRTAAPFQNNASFSGEIQGGEAGSGSDTIESIGGGGGGTSNRKAKLQVTKIDGLRTDLRLEGIVFNLYTDISGEKTLIDSKTTDGSGVLTFIPLTLNRSYYLEEVPYEGYSNPKVGETTLKEYVFTPTQGGVTEEITVTNAPKTANVEFTKVNELNLPLEGVTFTVTELRETENPITQTQKSQKDGKVVFTDLPFGSYQLVETETIANHILNTEIYTVTIDRDGKYEILNEKEEKVDTIINTTEKGNLIITKVDALRPDVRLEGVTFNLYTEVTGEKKLVGTQTTNARGQITFEGLSIGVSYSLEEDAYEGYSNPKVGETTLKEYVFTPTQAGVAEAITITNEPTTTNVEFTKKNDLTLPLVGTTFTITELRETENPITQTQKSQKDGKVVFTNLPFGSYRLVETETIANHILNTEIYTVTIDRDGKYQIVNEKEEKVDTIINTTEKGNLTITKVDTRRPDVRLAGVTFNLYTEVTGEKKLVGTQTTNEQGQLTFEGLSIGVSYYLEEDTYEGYSNPVVGETALKEFVFTPTQAGVTEEITVSNAPKTAKVEFTKVNDLALPLEGVTFTVTELRETENPITQTQKSQKDGKVVFTNLPFGSYRLEETETIANHILNTEIYTITIDRDGKYEIVNGNKEAVDTIINTTEKGNLTITKVDALRPDVRLEGVTFNLYTEVTGEKKLVGTQITNAQGQLTFEGLSIGVSYSLEEDTYEGYSNPVVGETALKEFVFTPTQAGVTEEITVSNAPKTANVEFTKVNDLTLPLEGVSFTVTELRETENPITQTQKSQKDGKVVFTDLPFGSYRLEETETVANHILSTEVYTITIGTDGKYQIVNAKEEAVDTIINATEKGNLTITKVDALRPDVRLEGVTFNLYTEVTGKEQLVGTKKTNEQGQLTFEGLSIGVSYYLKEDTYEGYSNPVVGETALKEFVYTPTQAGITEEITVTNVPNTFDVEFTKVNDLTLPLEGVSFTVTELRETENPITQTQKSQKDGKVVFTDLPFGSYRLEETETVANHILSTEVYTITIGTDGKYQIVNEKEEAVDTIINATEKGNLTITKVDALRPDVRLEGVTFNLYTEVTGEKKLVGTKTTNEQGQLTFEGLSVGVSYYLEEEAYKGYSDPKVGEVALEEYEILLTQAGVTEEITVTNTPTPISITPDPSTPSSNTPTGDSQNVFESAILAIVSLLMMIFLLLKKFRSYVTQR